MIIGAHSVLYSTNPEADRAFLRDVLRLTYVDVDHGWLIFGLPPAEIAVHPADKNNGHELFLMCDDVEAFVAEMATNGITCTPPQSQGWGVLTHLTLPGGGRLGVYQPRHARPEPHIAPRASGSGGRPPKGAKRARPKKSTRRTPTSKTKGNRLRKRKI
jgi:hypothetical protein